MASAGIVGGVGECRSFVHPDLLQLSASVGSIYHRQYLLLQPIHSCKTMCMYVCMYNDKHTEHFKFEYSNK